MANGTAAVKKIYGGFGVLALLLSFALPAYADEAEWLVAPYAWLSDVSYDQSVDDGASGGISARDLIDKADAAGMIRVEAAKARWGFTLDYLWLGLSDDTVVPVPPSPVPNLGVVAELDMGIVELGGFYRPSGDDHGVDYLFGLRRISTDTTLILIPEVGPAERFDRDSEYTDVFLGARYLYRFDENWDAALRGDVSFGDTEGTVNLLASVGYRFGRTFALQLGYRHATFEFDDAVSGVGETTDIELSGPFLGAVFRF
jgi:hypothetical protein